jgi:hypothetical protein
MAVVLSKFPAAIDTHLKIPKTPSVAKLSESESPDDYGYEGQNENSHADLHDAENRSIKAIESAVIVDNSASSHDHSDPIDSDYSSSTYQEHPDQKKGRQLKVKNTHVFVLSTAPYYRSLTDAEAAAPDTSLAAVHHSLGSNDSVKDYQGVSGVMWTSKSMKYVDSNTFADINLIASLWDSTIGAVTDGKLKSYIIALCNSLSTYKKKYDVDIPDLQAKYADLLARVKKIENRLPSGTDKLAHGNINVYGNDGSHFIATHDGSSDYDITLG